MMVCAILSLKQKATILRKLLGFEQISSFFFSVGLHTSTLIITSVQGIDLFFFFFFLESYFV